MLTILLTLVLFEKSAKTGSRNIPFTGRQELKNYSEPVLDHATGADSSQKDSQSQLPDPVLSEIPEIPDIDEVNGILEETGPKIIPVYFLKFYGKGNKSHSRLLKTTRKSDLNDKNEIEAALELLVKGPNQSEKSQGILSAIPGGLTFSRNFRIENHILHLSLGSEFEYGAGPELMKDRIDQIIYTLLEIDGITGITLYIDGKKVTSIGGDGVPVPSILTRNNRIIMTL